MRRAQIRGLGNRISDCELERFPRERGARSAIYEAVGRLLRGLDPSERFEVMEFVRYGSKRKIENNIVGVVDFFDIVESVDAEGPQGDNE